MAKLILLASAPRSGSTWTAKAIDSNPHVLYLHEPDIEDRGMDLLPHWFEQPVQGASWKRPDDIISVF